MQMVSSKSSVVVVVVAKGWNTERRAKLRKRNALKFVVARRLLFWKLIAAVHVDMWSPLSCFQTSVIHTAEHLVYTKSQNFLLLFPFEEVTSSLKRCRYTSPGVGIYPEEEEEAFGGSRGKEGG